MVLVSVNSVLLSKGLLILLYAFCIGNWFGPVGQIVHIDAFTHMKTLIYLEHVLNFFNQGIDRQLLIFETIFSNIFLGCSPCKETSMD